MPEDVVIVTEKSKKSRLKNAVVDGALVGAVTAAAVGAAAAASPEMAVTALEKAADVVDGAGDLLDDLTGLDDEQADIVAAAATSAGVFATGVGAGYGVREKWTNRVETSLNQSTNRTR